MNRFDGTESYRFSHRKRAIDVHIRMQLEYAHRVPPNDDNDDGDASAYAHYLWPSSIVLCQYLLHHLNEAREMPSVVIELGAGCALPSLLMAKVLSGDDSTLSSSSSPPVSSSRPSSWVVVTDCDNDLILDNIAYACRELNDLGCEKLAEEGIQDEDIDLKDSPTVDVSWREGTLFANGRTNCEPSNSGQGACTVLVSSLVWGHLWDFGHTGIVRNLPDASGRGQSVWIIGADVFFEPRLFEDLVASVALLLDTCHLSGHSAKFITAYHERCENRNITSLLRKWNLMAREVPLIQFLGYDAIDRGNSFASIFVHCRDMSEEQIERKYNEMMSSIRLFVIERCR